jgi:DNA-binding response OmpR family regulator
MDNATDNRGDGDAPPLIAVIDDNPLFLKMLRFYLPSVGYRVVTWTRATGAASLVERERPALVVLDMRMEHDRAGLAVLRALRGRPGTAGIPVLVVSAWADALTADERAEIRAARGDTMLKPFEFADLLGRMRGLMDAGE